MIYQMRYNVFIEMMFEYGIIIGIRWASVGVARGSCTRILGCSERSICS